MAIFETENAICIYRIDVQLTGSGWSGWSLVRVDEWSSGQVVRAVKVFMIAWVVQVVRWSGGQMVRWSGGQMVRW